MRITILAAVALLGMAFHTQAMPVNGADAGGIDGCRLRIEAGVTNWMIRGFDVFDSGEAEATFDVVFANDGTADCAFSADFSLDGEPFGLSRDAGGERASYVLFDSFTSYDATPVGGETRHSVTRHPIVVKPGQQQLVRFRFAVDRDELSHDGTWSQSVRLEADRDDGVQLGVRPIVLGVIVPPSARLGLAGAFTVRGGQPVVDLGALSEGLVRAPLRLRVDSTRRYRLTFESREGGRLRLHGTEWTVPYSLIVDERSVQLSGGAGEYVSGGPERLRRDSLPLGFVIGPTDDRRAGVYSDVLSITVAPE